jgi:hypothetical protein
MYMGLREASFAAAASACRDDAGKTVTVSDFGRPPKFSRNGHETVAHPTQNPGVGHQRPTHRPIAPWWGVVPSYSDHNAQTAELCELAWAGARMGGHPPLALATTTTLAQKVCHEQR